MALYTERIDVHADVVFWCGHREFDGSRRDGTILDTDFRILMANGTFAVICKMCHIKLANIVLANPTYLPDGGGPVTTWCVHRDWVNQVGQPVEGDRTIEVLTGKPAHLVACPACALRFALRIAQKAIRLKFETVEVLQEMIEAD